MQATESVDPDTSHHCSICGDPANGLYCVCRQNKSGVILAKTSHESDSLNGTLLLRKYHGNSTFFARKAVLLSIFV